MKRHWLDTIHRVVPTLRVLSLSISLCYLHSNTAAGQDADELSILQKQRADEVAASLKLINQRYSDELKKLLNVLTQSGDLDSALQVKQILESIASGGETSKSVDVAKETALRAELDGVALQWNPWQGHIDQIILNRDGTARWRVADGGKLVSERAVIWTIIDSNTISISISDANPHFRFNKTFSKFEWIDKQNIKYDGTVYSKGKAPRLE